MADASEPDEHLARKIFFPYTDEQSQKLQSLKPSRVAYYTSAETAFHILQTKKFWMRNTATMNDYLEVEHGFDCLKSAYHSEAGKVFQHNLDAIYPGLVQRAVERFDSWLPGIRQDTYITCFSEHYTSEDAHGRLSMWRAYGGQAGVALILNSEVLFAETEGIGVYASPVAYWTQQQVEAELRRVGERIQQNATFVQSLGVEYVESIVFNMFRFGVLSTKHPGFAEELEWRVVASPAMFKSPLLTASIQTVRGIPQVVQQVSLRNYPEIGLNLLEPEKLVDRILIGPCEYPAVIRRALCQLLEECEVQRPNEKVFISNIPLRSSSP